MLLHLLIAVAALPPPRCSLGVSLPRPSPEASMVLATYTGTQIPVLPSLDPRDEVYFWTPKGVFTVSAYRFEVIQVAGGTSGLIPGQTFLAIPWGYDAGCDLTVWDEGEWIPPGAEVVFEFRQSRASPTGEPLIDELGWHRPYPHAPWLTDDARRSGESEDPGDWLSAREFFRLQAIRPDSESFDSRSAYLEALEAVLQLDPRWPETYPGSWYLRRARRWAAEERGSSDGPPVA